MTDTVKLQRAISDSGLKMGYIAEKLGCHTETLRRKIHNENLFNAAEIDKLRVLLGLSINTVHEIFFAQNVDKSDR